MKVSRLTTHWDTEQVITVIEMLDELKEALMESYQSEIEQFRYQQWRDKNEQQSDLDDHSVDF